MPANTKMYWLHALTPLHVGSGRGMGFIDLPIVREKVTKWPLVPGSAVKGVVADHSGATKDARESDTPDGKLLKAAFGLSGDDYSNSGSLVFTDARLACLPVRSLYGTFAWVTSPLLLLRLKRDLELAGLASSLPEPEAVTEQDLHCPQGTASALKDASNKVYLEDLDFAAHENSIAATWADKIASWVFPHDPTWQGEFKKRFAVIANDSFDFLSETGTEVNAHIRIEQEKKTVAKGALWYEEALPTETILAGLVWCDRVYPKNGTTQEQLMQQFCTAELKLQIGGKATVGKGQIRCLFS